MANKVKILIAGDVAGNFNQLFQRVTSINRKNGPFELLLCVGNFFSDDQEKNDELVPYKNGTKKVPVPTFILGPNSKELATQYEGLVEGEICSNLTYLGKRGLYTLSSGIRVAYLSGREKPNKTNESNNSEEYYFTKEDVLALCNSCKINPDNYRGVDILLTSAWPKGLREKEVKICSSLISSLCKEILPRYHFCGLNGEHYESKPFRISSDAKFSTSTRFVGLAEVGNETKQKYFFAMNVTPLSEMSLTEIVQKTIDEEPCPFDSIPNTLREGMKQEDNHKRQYFFDMNGSDSDPGAHKGGVSKAKKAKIIHVAPETCWFCLSRSETEKHLIVAVGEHFYLAMDKGPLNRLHVLILSITHISSVAQLTEDTWPELLQFKDALRCLFREEGKVVCFTERNYKSSHLQINVLGIDEQKDSAIKKTFQDLGENYHLEFQVFDEPLNDSHHLPPQGPYFVAELPDKTTLLTRQMKRFPINFAREVFCSQSLLNCPQKINWRQCILQKDEEIHLVAEFRKKFEKYNFTK